jgi:MFS family permease
VNIGRSTKTTLLLLSMMTMMSNVAIVTSLPHLKDHFPGETEIEFFSRLMITLPSLSIALLAPFLGHLLHRLPRRASVVAALLLFGIAGSAGLYLQGIEVLLASRAVLGIDIGWRYPFGIYLIGILFIPLVLRFIVEPAHPKEEEGGGGDGAGLLGIYLLAFVLMLIFYILPTQMPFLMIDRFGASGALTGAIIATAFIFNALGALTFSKLKKRFDFPAIYMIGMTVIGIGFVLIGEVRDVHLFFLTSPVMGFGGGILMTSVMAWMLSRSHHKRRVKSSGYLSSSLFLGQFFSPIVFHPAVVYFGVQHFFVVTGSLLLAAVAASALLHRAKGRAL